MSGSAKSIVNWLFLGFNLNLIVLKIKGVKNGRIKNKRLEILKNSLTKRTWEG
jgi:hypothetical protein